MLAAALLTAPQLAQAQATGGVTREQLELPEPDTAPAAPSVEFRIDRNAEVRENCPFDGQALTINLSSVQFRPIGSDPDAVLHPEIQSVLSEVGAPTGERNLSVVCDIRDAANSALRRAGYIATVQVPEQALNDTLILNVITARIVEVRVSGDPGPYRELFEERLQALQELDPVNERDAERILLGLEDIPGVGLRLSLSPTGRVPGEVFGNLVVTYTPYTTFANVRNYNARNIGRETAFARIEFNGLTKRSDVTFLGVQTTADFKEQFVVQGGHAFDLGYRGLRLSGELAYAASEPDVEGIDLSTDALLGSLELTYPWIRKPNFGVNVSTGLDYVDQTTEISSFAISDDALRTLYARGDVYGNRRRANGNPLLNYRAFGELRQGIGIFGATKIGPGGTSQTDGVAASRPFGDPEAFVARAGLDASVSATSVFGARARIDAQWTDDPLLNFDEFSVGNLTIGRGFDPGANSGDRAIGGAFELSANALRSERFGSLQLFGFYDIVEIENLDIGTADPKRTLRSAGGGIRLFSTNGITAELTYAAPLNRALVFDLEEPPERVLFSLTGPLPRIFR